MLENTFKMNKSSNPALTLFWRALSHAKWHWLWAKLTHRAVRLQSLEETLQGTYIEAEHYAGVKTVLIDRIRGTLGKAGDFDAEFNPTQERTRERWLDIALQKLRGHDLPPVDLVQVDDVYYVRDGHHRISVAHSLGQAYIDAQITVMQTRRNLNIL